MARRMHTVSTMDSMGMVGKRARGIDGIDAVERKTLTTRKAPKGVRLKGEKGDTDQGRFGVHVYCSYIKKHFGYSLSYKEGSLLLADV